MLNIRSLSTWHVTAWHQVDPVPLPAHSRGWPEVAWLRVALTRAGVSRSPGSHGEAATRACRNALERGGPRPVAWRGP